MNFKKFIFKNRYLIIVFLVFIIPTITLALWEDRLTYDIHPNSVQIPLPIYPRQSNNIDVATSSAICVNNTSTSTYFVGNKTQAEIQSFLDHMPPGVSLRTCCIDGVCTNGENYTNCPDDCLLPCSGTFTDSRDSQTYPMVQIGNQCWMGGNLNVGTRIDVANNQGDYSAGVTKYCYSDNSGFCTIFGGLYQWHTAMGLSQSCDTSDSCVVDNSVNIQGICPTGWHLPNSVDWSSLESNVNSIYASSDAVSKLNQTGASLLKIAASLLRQTGTAHWSPPNSDANNLSGFNAIAGGYVTFDHKFSAIAGTSLMWSATKDGMNSAGSYLAGNYFIKQINDGGYYNEIRPYGESVRCLRDMPAPMPAPTFICGTFVTGIDGLTYGTVLGADGNCWLDRNLGATRVAQSATDTSASGYLYQWGRGWDGHQVSTSITTVTQSSTPKPTHGYFILADNWLTIQNSYLWQGVDGVNNPCPAGFEVPTDSDWQTLYTAAGITNDATAFNSSLKFPVTGGRSSTDGAMYSIDSGRYWSNTPFGTSWYYEETRGVNGISLPGNGNAVRCIINH